MNTIYRPNRLTIRQLEALELRLVRRADTMARYSAEQEATLDRAVSAMARRHDIRRAARRGL